MEHVLVTGGAGFMGSHLVDSLITRGASVCVFDDLSNGNLQNLYQSRDRPNFCFIKGDLLKPSDLKKLEGKSYELVFHLAANPEVRVGSADPNTHFQQNVIATHNLLEYLRKAGSNPTLVFTSTSTVYGEPTQIPTPEDYAPLKPISIYGATKLACEALITAYVHTYNFKAIIYRLANIVGPRSPHGIVPDFIKKLTKNPRKLEILGDGTQNKSYLYITDCIQAMLHGLKHTKKQTEIYNVGSEDQITVTEIAQIIIKEMNLKKVRLTCTGGVDGGRGWKGDVKNMLLETKKIKALGWKPKHNSQQSIIKTAKAHADTFRKN